jgi:hypothetical protein
MDSPLENSAEAEVDRLLGDKALIKLDALQPLGGPSRPTLQRAAKAGMIELVHNGSSSNMTRATAKHILLRGLGPIPFLYGKQGMAKLAKAETVQMAVRAKHAAQQAQEPEPIGDATKTAKRAKKTDKFENVA